jgi:hypothetical protein
MAAYSIAAALTEETHTPPDELLSILYVLQTDRTDNLTGRRRNVAIRPFTGTPIVV